MHKLKLLILFLFLFVIIFTLTMPCFAEETTYVWSSSSTPVSSTNTENNTNNIISTNSSEETNSNSLNLESASAILIEQSTGQVLYEHNVHEQLRPASVTKVMSILLIMEALDNGKITLNDSVPCSENAASMGGSQIWLDPRETLTVDEMLKAICVASANDYKVQFKHKTFNFPVSGKLK